jgi:type II secretory ATPase GspE/PulE/Tfp pilus assembly ATPase PilB-like protein
VKSATRETADLALRASLTGHLVFSTLHTNDAASAINRLLDLGVNTRHPGLILEHGHRPTAG